MSITGYHMHMGVTSGPDHGRPFAQVGSQPDGASSIDGLVAGTYMHGLFASDAFRHAFLNTSSNVQQRREVERALDNLARHIGETLNLDELLSLAVEVR